MKKRRNAKGCRGVLSRTSLKAGFDVVKIILIGRAAVLKVSGKAFSGKNQGGVSLKL